MKKLNNKDIELRNRLFFDGIMDNDYELVLNILTEHPELINATIDYPILGSDNDDGLDDPIGTTPLLASIAFSDYKMFEMILDVFSADPNKSDNEGLTPLWNISMGSMKEMGETRDMSKWIDLIVEYGGNVNLATDADMTPLMVASESMELEIVKKLLRHGADANAKDDTGYNCLTWMSMYYGKESPNRIDELVKVLVDSGADINATTPSGYTPLSLAREYNNPVIVKTLLNHGAIDNIILDDTSTP